MGNDTPAKGAKRKAQGKAKRATVASVDARASLLRVAHDTLCNNQNILRAEAEAFRAKTDAAIARQNSAISAAQVITQSLLNEKVEMCSFWRRLRWLLTGR